MDIRERDSKWSEPVEFTTANALEADVILQPDIISPVNEGWVPEKKLIVQLTQPEAIGVAVPDAMDLQVSITPDFDTGDIVQDYVDYADPRLLVDDTVNFSAAPSPLYLRARQKDSVRSLASQWSSVPTVWLQRAFSDLCIGIEVNTEKNNSFAFWIDKDGNRIQPNQDYFDNHPIWGGMFHTTWDDSRPTPKTHDVVRLPGFYTRAESLVNPVRHRIWISPVSLDGFYLHPCFEGSPAGLYVAGALISGTGDNTAAVYDVAAVYDPNINLISNGNQKVRLTSIHLRAALQLLIIIEKSTIDLRSALPGSGRNNDSTGYNYRGIRSLFTHGGTPVQWSGISILNGGVTSPPFNRNGPVLLSVPGTETPAIEIGNIDIDPIEDPLENALTTRNVASIYTGFNAELRADLELYFIPKTVAVASYVPITKYQNVYRYKGGGESPGNILNVMQEGDCYTGLSAHTLQYGAGKIARFMILD
jgi:hypothetical protein